jgi:hypothetical protein
MEEVEENWEQEPTTAPISSQPNQTALPWGLFPQHLKRWLPLGGPASISRTFLGLLDLAQVFGLDDSGDYQ